MKAILKIIIFFLAVHSVYGQTAFVHTATKTNTNVHITSIDNAASNGNPNAILIVNQRNDKSTNANEIGVWYNQGKWKIYNQNKKSITANSQFNVLILDPKKVRNTFVHTTSASNTSSNTTTLNSSLTNNNSNAQILVTPVYGKYNLSSVGVWYNKGKWKIYNEKKSKMPIGTKFNVFVYNKGTSLKGQGNVTGINSFVHKVKSKSSIVFGSPRSSKSQIYTSTIDQSGLNGNSSKLIFFTPHFKGTYNGHPVGLNYKSKKWSVSNLDKRPFKNGLAFNMYALDVSLTVQFIQPLYTATVFTDPVKEKLNVNGSKKNPVVTSAVLKNVYKPGQFMIVPLGTKAGNSSEESSSSEEVSVAIQGPNMEVSGMIMLDNIFDDEGYELFLEKLNIGRTIYWDGNPNSNTVYYLPSKYNLNWIKETGEYGFSTFYLSAQGNESGKVLVNAELTPSIAKEDIAFTQELLSNYFKKELNLVPMILSQIPSVEFGNELLSLDVDKSSIAITIPEDFLDPIVVTWSMGSRIDDLVALMKEQFGITGKVIFTPFSENESNKQSDIILKLNHEDTYGVFEFASASEVVNGIKNSTDYPLMIQNFVVLKEKTNKELYVEKIALTPNRIEPGAYYGEWTNAEKNSLLEGDLVKKIWLDYTLDQDCPNCDSAVDDKILSGTTGPRSHSIEVTIINPLEHTGAYTIKLKIKSLQADPKGRSKVERTYNITEDGIELNAGELFYTENESPNFEYQILVIEPDGNVKESNWMEHDALYLIIGSALIDNLFNE